MDYIQRKESGDNAEAEFDAIMRAAGFVVSPTGQESAITPELRAALIRVDDQAAREMRFQPDRFLVREQPPFPTAYWEVKSQTDSYPNFGIEQDHWTTNAGRVRAGVKIIYAFREFGGVWRADWMSNLLPLAAPHPGGPKGSRKPMVRIPCVRVPRLEKFLAGQFVK